MQEPGQDPLDVRNRVEFIGPMERHEVVVNGWQVPLMEAEPLRGGRVLLTLDQRFALELSLEEAERVVPFLADAISISLGYTCHPREDMDRPVPTALVGPRRFHRVAWAETEEPPDLGP